MSAKDVYAEIAEKAFSDNHPYYGDLIVAIRLDGVVYNEILEFNAADFCGIWFNDWYEGQKEVEYLGSILVGEVKVPYASVSE